MSKRPDPLRAVARCGGAILAGLAWSGLATAQLPQPACLEPVTPVEFPDTQILAVARDGSTMVGDLLLSSAPFRIPFVWRMNEQGAFEGSVFPVPPELASLTLRAASDEGRVLVGDAQFPIALNGRRAFRWSEATGFEYLDTGFDLNSHATDVSADGTKVVGGYDHDPDPGILCATQPASGFIWEGASFTQLRGADPLGPLPLPDGDFVNPTIERQNRASAAAISGDGQWIIGISQESQSVADPEGFPVCTSQPGKTQATYWTAAGGVGTLLGDLGGSCNSVLSPSFAEDVSYDGGVITGTAHFDCEIFPVKWVGGSSAIPTHDVSRAGSNLGVSEDGSVVLVGVQDGALREVRAFQESPLPRRIDDLLTEDFCVDLGDDEFLTMTDFTDLEGGGVIVFAARDSSGAVAEKVLVLPCPDPDEDNLCSEWEEMGGIDLDGDGVIKGPPAGGDLVLAGADPMHKDIFVEVDELRVSARGLFLEALLDVENAFGRVPNALIGNPDGRPGIRLHLEFDASDQDLELISGTEVWAPDPGSCALPGDMSFFRATKFGSVDQRTDADVLAAKHALYRYLVFGGKLNGVDWSGVAEPFGNDAIVTLWHFPVQDGTPEEQAATIMHELGHTFGLRHGGVDHLNFKPNYKSVMNYTWQFRGDLDVANAPLGRLAYRHSWVLDYSRRTFPVLTEAALLETVPIGFDARNWVPVGPVRPCLLSLGSVCARLVNEALAIDWDEDGTFSAGVVGPIDVNNVEIDAVSPNEVLAGQTDWPIVADLYEDFRHPNWKASTPLSESCQNFGATPEEAREGLVDMTPEDIAALDQPLAIDCDENGVVDDDDLAAGADTDANGNGVLDGCEPLAGDVDGDDDVDEDDRLLLLASFGRGEGEGEYLDAADLDGDRLVTFADYYLWTEASEAFEAAATASAAQPGCGLIGIEVVLPLWCSTRRRRRRCVC